MRVLLDTHSFLWFIEGSQKLSSEAREIISDFDNGIVLSIASIWELTIKVSLGRLELKEPLEVLIKQQLEEHEITVLPIELNHLGILRLLPYHHRDPFDRLIVSQAISENLPVISKDQEIPKYEVKVIW